MKIYQLISILFLFLLTNSFAYAKVKIENMEFKISKTKGVVSVFYKGNLNAYPELNIVGKSIQVTIPDSKINTTINKSYRFSSRMNDTTVKVYQTSNRQSKIKMLFPFKIEGKKDQVSLTIKDNRIELSFPRVFVKIKKAPKYASLLKKKNKVKREFLNEKYLNSLLKMDKATKKKLPSKKVKFNGHKEIGVSQLPEDKVNMALASPFRTGKKSNSSISLIEYGGKFVAFLGLVLLLFYGVVALMKKGFISKGKLGFLNNADKISVISQTYIAPKKSLMLIRAHNQVFLVSNTDQGILPISEIKDAAGLFKDGELALSGQNFDTNLGSANSDNKLEEKVKIKDDITKSNQQSSLSSYMNITEKVKFTDQLKKKVRNLKPLQ